MVGSCAAYGCTHRKQKGVDISFVNFPHHNPEHLQKWVQAMQRKDWFPSKHCLICSTNFTESCFVVRLGKRGRLIKENAVPTRVSCISKSLTKMYWNGNLPWKGCQKSHWSKCHHPRYGNKLKLTIHTTQQSILPHRKLNN